MRRRGRNLRRGRLSKAYRPTIPIITEYLNGSVEEELSKLSNKKGLRIMSAMPFVGGELRRQMDSVVGEAKDLVRSIEVSLCSSHRLPCL